MSPEVDRLFEEASQLSPEQRLEFLETNASNPEVRREVLSLLAHDEFAQPFFQAAIQSAAASVLTDMALPPGARIGAFTIVRMVGRGGMGAVYLANRADGGFEQTVAIKVIQSFNPTPRLRERFEQERQILARLSHPNIARLLDGGETPSGSPYFVMEYVSGEEIDSYCNRRSLNLSARLQLILHVAEAVQYAHENLVVHRDLKPENTLVGEDGIPKLLDFGIAKVLDPLSGQAATTVTRVLTPEYASPEQIRGDAVTTAADIYSLGAVLYRLVTGRPPHSIEGLSPLEAARKVSEEDITVPRDVPADVAAILRKALHNDPLHRYRSAAEFSNDIERFLDGKAVLAVPDSMGYRTAKFVRRHWIVVAAAAAVMLSLTVGAAVAIRQGRRAEQRFAEVRELSNQFLFEFEGAIHDVPGTLKARELVIKTAQRYLDRLAQDAGGDRTLIHELADAYQKLGDVQGNTVGGNIGDVKSALASYRRAVTLRDSVGDAQASNTKIRVAYLFALISLANEEAVSGDPARALPLCEKAVSTVDAWLKNGSNDPDLLTSGANSYSQLSTHQMKNGDFQGAVASARHSVALQIRARELRPQEEKLLRAVAVRYWGVGSAEKLAGHAQEAVAAYSTAKDLLRQVAQHSPGNAQSKRELLGASWILANAMVDVLHEQKKSQESALLLWEDAWRMGTQLLKEDPGNALVEDDLTLINLGRATCLRELGHSRDALEILTPAIAAQERRYGAAPENRTAEYYLALLEVESADCRRDLSDLAESLKAHRAAESIFGRLISENPNNFQYRHDSVSNLKGSGDILAQLGDYDGAGTMYRKALEIADSMPKGQSLDDVAPLIAGLHKALDDIARK
jgi:eukaryotic-like serine/threonine-protein kinase